MADQLQLAHEAAARGSTVAAEEIVLRRADLVVATCQGTVGIDRSNGPALTLRADELRWLLFAAGPAALDHLAHQ